MPIPVVTAGADQTKTFSGSPQAIALTAVATESPTGYTWTMKDVPPGSVAATGTNGDFTNGVSIVQNPSFNVDASISGSYVCECIATNVTGDSNPEADKESCQTIVTVGTQFADEKVPGNFQFSYGEMLNTLLLNLINKKLDDLNVPDDNTDLDVSIAAHGLAPKLPNDVTKFFNGIGGYTVPTAAAHLLGGSQHTADSLANLNAKITGGDLDFSTASRPPSAHNTEHQSGGSDAIKLDDLAAPDDNTDLDASSAAHGLMKKLSNVATEVMNGQGDWTDLQPAAGSISAYNNATATTITVLNTWYQVTVFDTNGPSTGDVTPDHTNDHLTIAADGDYNISFSASFFGQANSTYEIMVQKNNGTTLFTALAVERKLGTGGDIGVIATSGVVTLSAGDTIELWIRDVVAAPADATFKHVSLSASAVSAVGVSAGTGIAVRETAAQPTANITSGASYVQFYPDSSGNGSVVIPQTGLYRVRLHQLFWCAGVHSTIQIEVRLNEGLSGPIVIGGDGDNSWRTRVHTDKLGNMDCEAFVNIPAGTYTTKAYFKTVATTGNMNIIGTVTAPASDASLSFQLVSSSGSIGASYIGHEGDTPPAVAHALNDEFTGSAPLGGTWIRGGEPTASAGNVSEGQAVEKGVHWMRAINDSSPRDQVTDHHARAYTVPAGAWTLETRVQATAITDYNFQGLFVDDGSDANGDWWKMGHGGVGQYSSVMASWMISSSQTHDRLLTPCYDNKAYLRISYDNVDKLTFYYSTDGIVWIWRGAHTIGYTPSRFGYFLHANTNGGTDTEVAASFEYIRVTQP